MKETESLLAEVKTLVNEEVNRMTQHFWAPCKMSAGGMTAKKLDKKKSEPITGIIKLRYSSI
jgi:hypothetical protein